MTSKSGYIGALSPEYALLGLLAQQSDHGYELHQRLVNALGHIWHISQSQVYNILKRLEAKGDIIGEIQPQEKLPDRRFYSLTPTGRARFEAWLETPTRPSVRAIRVEFLTRLYFINQSNRETLESLFQNQEQELRRGVMRLERLRASLPPEQVFNRLSLDLRIRQLSSILEWLEDCRRSLSVGEGVHRGDTA